MRVSYIVYEVATGVILRTGYNDETSVWNQPLAPGEALMIGEADARTQRVERGMIVRIPDAR